MQRKDLKGWEDFSMAKGFWAFWGGVAVSAAAVAGYALYKAHKSAMFDDECRDEPVITIDPDEETEIFDEEARVHGCASENVQDKIDDIGEKVSGMVGKAAEKAEDFGRTVKDAFQGTAEKVAEKAENIVNRIKNDADDMFGDISQ